MTELARKHSHLSPAFCNGMMRHSPSFDWSLIFLRMRLSRLIRFFLHFALLILCETFQNYDRKGFLVDWKQESFINHETLRNFMNILQ